MTETAIGDRVDWYRSRSLWLSQIESFTPRGPLDGDIEADVAIVGGGFVGIWAAYYLNQRDPSLNVVVLERETVGFGAAGRNGGWAGAGIAGSASAYAKRSGAAAVRDGAQLMRDAVDEIGRVVTVEGIDCGFVKGGTLGIAMTQPQLARLRSEFASPVAASLRADDETLLAADEVTKHLQLGGVLGGSFTPHCARIQPAKLGRVSYISG